jgi:hypothetical protein
MGVWTESGDYWVFGLHPLSSILKNATFWKLNLFLSSGKGMGGTYSVGSARKEITSKTRIVHYASKAVCRDSIHFCCATLEKWTDATTPVIPNDIHHHQNALGIWLRIGTSSRLMGTK